MGVYIKDAQKSTSCGTCELWSNCYYPTNPYDENDDYIPHDCPAVDIVDDFGAFENLQGSKRIYICGNYGNKTEMWVNVSLLGVKFMVD